jgi:hypothetical protein
MQTSFLVFSILICLIAVFAIYRYVKVSYQNRKLNEQRFERIKPLFEKLKRGESVNSEDVLPFAENIMTRGLTFLLLKTHEKMDLFPSEYYTLVKSSESHLANWLEFPTELDAIPDEMEHMQRVSLDFDGQGNYVHYEVFKYRVNEPHWAAKDGWTIGVVGPYFDDSEPYSPAGSTFSRIGSKADKITPEEEARWVHEHISLRRK